MHDGSDVLKGRLRLGGRRDKGQEAVGRSRGNIGQRETEKGERGDKWAHHRDSVGRWALGGCPGCRAQAEHHGACTAL